MSEDLPPSAIAEPKQAPAPPDSDPRTPTAISVVPGLWMIGLAAACVILLALGGDPLRQHLRYERTAVLQGEYWRLLTGHLVHGSPSHLFLNVAGLGLIATLFPRHYSVSQWLLIVVGSLLAIDCGFVLNEPQLDWYVGLSGVLHGVLAGGAIAWWRYETRSLALTLSAILVLKLAWEQWQGALPLSGDMPVIVDAHLYGAVGGCLAALSIFLARSHWSGAPRSL